MKINNAAGELGRLIGNEKVKTGKEFLLSYSYDATDHKYPPQIVVFPSNGDDVKKILKTAKKYRIPVTPRGGGVGNSGGSVPFKGGIVLAFSKMNRILRFDEESRLIVVEPGVITYDVHNECEKRGFFYPPDPASLKNSTIGGNVAENAGGPRCFKYGVTSDYVLSIEGYLMNGEKVRFGSNSIKDVAGYDLKKIIVGSEGTLVVMTGITLRVIPKPEKRILIRFGFKTLRDGAEFINKIIRRNISPSVLEFMDKNSLDAVYDYMNIKSDKKPGSIVLMELDGTRDEIETGLKSIEELKDRSDIIEYRVAASEEEEEKLWDLRRNLSPAISRIKPKKISEDIAVPTGKIPETIEFITNASKEYNIEVVMFGHLGDGNIHTNLMIDPSSEQECRSAEALLDKIFKFVISSNGSITGEHGIGLSKKRFLSYQYGKAEIELFKGIKKIFDPDNLLNPGKIF